MYDDSLPRILQVQPQHDSVLCTLSAVALKQPVFQQILLKQE